MPGSESECLRLRRAVERLAAGGEPSPELTAHAADCDTCLEALLDAALANPESVQVPAGFADRTLALAGESPKSVLPWTVAAACVAFAGIAACTFYVMPPAELGHRLTDAVLNLRVIAAVAAIEAGATFAWLWKLARE